MSEDFPPASYRVGRSCGPTLRRLIGHRCPVGIRYASGLAAITLAAALAGIWPGMGQAAERAVGGLKPLRLASTGTAPNDRPTAADEDAPLRLVISRDDQRLDVYRGLTHISSSRISTGKAGHRTPLGIYSILEKRRYHRSNIYSAAPMPYMQRLTWSGIALHEGYVPNYPASHGCIRLPKAFARELFSLTKVGAEVIITGRSDGPMPISHPTLFQPWHPDMALGTHSTGLHEVGVHGIGLHDLDTVPSDIRDNRVIASADGMSGVADTASDAQSGLRGGIHAPAIKPDPASVALADLEYTVDRIEAYKRRSTAPLRILVTQRTGRQRMMDIQRLLARLGHDPGPIDGYLGSLTGRAIQGFQRERDLAPTGMVTDDLVAALYAAAGIEEPSGHLYVRQKRKDIFDAPVTLVDADLPLGTHVFSVRSVDEGTGKARWTVLNVGDGSPTASARAALDRVKIPAYARRRIAELLMPGSSVIISDAGRGRETMRGTDFIVQP